MFLLCFSSSSVPYDIRFSGLSIFDCHFGILYESGFIRGHSTVYQLLEMYHRVCQNLDERLSTILIFCDISKEFGMRGLLRN